MAAPAQVWQVRSRGRIYRSRERQNGQTKKQEVRRTQRWLEPRLMPPKPPEQFKVGSDPVKTHNPVGRCIYCYDDSPKLSDEHIIPFSLNGTHILPHASCLECAQVTSQLELVVCREHFGQLRAHARLRTRRNHPDQFFADLIFEDGHRERVPVPIDIHPSVLVVPQFEMPTLLSRRTSDGNFRIRENIWHVERSLEWDEFVKARGAKQGAIQYPRKPQEFARFLAKIAHAYAVARLGIDGFNPSLTDLILGRNVVRAPELVGSEPEIAPPASGVLHELDLLENGNFLIVRIRLFASSSIEGAHGFPTYLVVAGAKISRLGALLAPIYRAHARLKRLIKRPH
jgi:hypothetical protein